MNVNINKNLHAKAIPFHQCIFRCLFVCLLFYFRKCSINFLLISTIFVRLEWSVTRMIVVKETNEA